MLTIQAPWPTIQTTIVLPNPQFSDAENLTDNVSNRRMMDGTQFTYVKTKTQRKLQWRFRLSRHKALELEAFLHAYFASQVRVTDHNDTIWVGNFIDNPFELATPDYAPQMPGGEMESVTLDFEGVKQ